MFCFLIVNNSVNYEIQPNQMFNSDTTLILEILGNIIYTTLFITCFKSIFLVLVLLDLLSCQQQYDI